MAAERMPDFKEINRLIESLQMLDRSFQRITSEYGERQNLRSSLRNFSKRSRWRN